MELMDEKKLQTLAVLVDNEAGVLSQVSRLFSRKGYNIESKPISHWSATSCGSCCRSIRSNG